MNLSIQNKIPKYNQSLTIIIFRGMLFINYTWLLNTAPVNLTENVPYDFF